MVWSDVSISLAQAAVFRRKAGEVQGRGQCGAPGEPVSSTPFGRLVGDIDSSGEPQVSPRPTGHLEKQLSQELLQSGLPLHRHGLKELWKASRCVCLCLESVAVCECLANVSACR